MKNLGLKATAVTLLLLTTTLVSAQKGYTINMELQGFKDSTVFKLKNLDLDEYIDSAYLVNGKLSFKGSVTKPVAAWIHTRNKLIVLYIENAIINITGNYDNFQYSKIDGTELNLAWIKSRDLQKPYQLKRDSLVQLYFSLSDSTQKIQGKSIWSEIAQADSSMLQRRLEIIKGEKPNYFTINEVFYLRSLVERDTLRTLFERFPKDLQAVAQGQVIRQFLSNPRPEVGTRFIDIDANDVSGKKIKLSDMKGKYILLDFWASWCGPCRQENPEFVKIYQEYKDQGFVVYSFSTDINKASWLKAIAADQLPWTNVSDQKGFHSKGPASYQVTGLPQNFLIDHNGIIIAKGLRGASLAAKLKEVFRE